MSWYSLKRWVMGVIGACLILAALVSFIWLPIQAVKAMTNLWTWPWSSSEMSTAMVVGYLIVHISNDLRLAGTWFLKQTNEDAE